MPRLLAPICSDARPRARVGASASAAADAAPASRCAADERRADRCVPRIQGLADDGAGRGIRRQRRSLAARPAPARRHRWRRIELRPDHLCTVQRLGLGLPERPVQFESWADGIDAVAGRVFVPTTCPRGARRWRDQPKYAPIGAANDPTGLNNNWTINVSRFLIEQGGDPNDVDLDGIAGTIPLGPLGGASVESFGFEDAEELGAARRTSAGARGCRRHAATAGREGSQHRIRRMDDRAMFGCDASTSSRAWLVHRTGRCRQMARVEPGEDASLRGAARRGRLQRRDALAPSGGSRGRRDRSATSSSVRLHSRCRRSSPPISRVEIRADECRHRGRRAHGTSSFTSATPGRRRGSATAGRACTSGSSTPRARRWNRGLDQ